MPLNSIEDFYADPPYSFLVTYWSYGLGNALPTIIESFTLKQIHSIIIGQYDAQMRKRAYTRNGQYPNASESLIEYFIPTGIFTRYIPGLGVCSESQTSSSGLIGIEYIGVFDVEELRQALLADSFLEPSIMLLFNRPKGDGVNMVVATEHRIWHRHNYIRLIAYLNKHHCAWQMHLIKEGSSLLWSLDIGRDPEAYLSPNHEEPTPFPMRAWLTKQQRRLEQRYGVNSWPATSHNGFQYLQMKGLR